MVSAGESKNAARLWDRAVKILQTRAGSSVENCNTNLLKSSKSRTWCFGSAKYRNRLLGIYWKL